MFRKHDLAMTFILVASFSSTAARAGDPIPVCISAQGTLRIVEFEASCAKGEAKKIFQEWEAETEDTPEAEDDEAGQRLAKMSKQIQELSTRLAALESKPVTPAKEVGTPTPVSPSKTVAMSRVTAPFEVVSRSGQVLLRVAEKVSSTSGDGARVTIGAGDAGNYGVRVFRDGKTFVAGLGQARDGAGVVVVMDDAGELAANLNGSARRISVFQGEHAAASMTAEQRGGTLAVYDGTQAVAYLTRSSHGKGGNLTLATSAGFGVFSAGAASDGGGEACLNRVTGGGQQRNVCLGVELPSMGLGK